MLKQAHQGATSLKKASQHVSFTNVLNQSTDAMSNAHFGGKPDVSSSFIRDVESVDEEEHSFEMQSMASSNMPSFDGSKMFAKCNAPLVVPTTAAKQS